MLPTIYPESRRTSYVILFFTVALLITSLGLYILKVLGIKPKRTLRAVMFMNEENGLRGAKKYASIAKEKEENHIAAIESDAGGFTPRGFGVLGTPSAVEKIKAPVVMITVVVIDYYQKVAKQG